LGQQLATFRETDLKYAKTTKLSALRQSEFFFLREDHAWNRFGQLEKFGHGIKILFHTMPLLPFKGRFGCQSPPLPPLEGAGKLRE